MEQCSKLPILTGLTVGMPLIYPEDDPHADLLHLEYLAISLQLYHLLYEYHPAVYVALNHLWQMEVYHCREYFKHSNQQFTSRVIEILE